ncbi:cytochrome bd-I oxidase subunit CydX [Paraburkholderia kirstenboschensis]|uniref:Cytochrome bd-I oxidase subunit CydX n=1 Tax=Paraburkholderia kirstenboschensis TaxID=1245436 RepID=A0ABZ0ETJ3_9BURK|nr:cytochrome bd-I oxidase subunit CydX [Paraburkholderia kirstenboschensis]WOD20235.1 cytochrome bd-I oxidase subunit CydX [Paraburkholderia kirstenboschensis]
MCYFTRIAGMGAALSFGIVDAIGLQANRKFARDPQRTAIRAQGESS